MVDLLVCFYPTRQERRAISRAGRFRVLSWGTYTLGSSFFNLGKNQDCKNETLKKNALVDARRVFTFWEIRGPGSVLLQLLSPSHFEFIFPSPPYTCFQIGSRDVRPSAPHRDLRPTLHFRRGRRVGDAATGRRWSVQRCSYIWVHSVCRVWFGLWVQSAADHEPSRFVTQTGLRVTENYRSRVRSPPPPRQ